MEIVILNFHGTHILNYKMSFSAIDSEFIHKYIFLSGQTAWTNAHNVKNYFDDAISDQIFTALTGKSYRSINNIQSEMDDLIVEIDRNEKSINKVWDAMEKYWQGHSSLDKQKIKFETKLRPIDLLHSKLVNHIYYPVFADPIFWTKFLRNARDDIARSILNDLQRGATDLVDLISKQRQVSILFYYSKVLALKTSQLKILKKRIHMLLK